MSHLSEHNRTTGLKSAVMMLLLLTGLGGLLYGHVIRAPFVFDDVLIPNEPRLAWTELSFDNLAGLTRVAADNVASRIIVNLTFALNYLLGGHQAGGYRLVNLIIHIITAWLVFLTARRVMIRVRSRSPLAPAAAALLWLVHPLHIESVTYIWQRMNSLATLFYLLSFYLYFSGRERQLSAPGESRAAWPLFAGCALAGLLALGCKQTALTLPLLLPAAELFFFQDLRVDRVRGKVAWALLLTAMLIVLVMIFPGANPLAVLRDSYQDKLFTMGQRLLTQPGVIIYYLTLIFWPHPARLNLDFDFPLSTTLLTPAATLVALAALPALIMAVVYAARKKRLAAFALLWFLVTLIPESSIYGLDLIWGYRTYLPSIFILIALAALLPDHRRPAATGAATGRIALIGVIVIIGIGALWTIQRNHIWQSDLTLWLDTARKSPAKARPHHNLGQALQGLGDYAGAIRHYRLALGIKRDTLGPAHPETARTCNNLGVAYDQQGETDQAIEAFAKALKIYLEKYGSDHVQTAAVYNNLGVLHGRAGKTDEAIYFCGRALAIRLRIFGPDHPETAEIYNNLGMAYSDKKEFEVAGGYFRKALPVFERHLGEDHPRTVMTRLSLKRLGPEEKGLVDKVR